MGQAGKQQVGSYRQPHVGTLPRGISRLRVRASLEPHPRVEQPQFRATLSFGDQRRAVEGGVVTNAWPAGRAEASEPPAQPQFPVCWNRNG